MFTDGYLREVRQKEGDQHYTKNGRGNDWEDWEDRSEARSTAAL